MDTTVLQNVESILCPWLKNAIGEVCLGNKSQCFLKKKKNV